VRYQPARFIANQSSKGLILAHKRGNQGSFVENISIKPHRTVQNLFTIEEEQILTRKLIPRWKQKTDAKNSDGEQIRAMEL